MKKPSTNLKYEIFYTCNEALELRELGFDEVCFGYYNTTWNKPDELLFPQYAGELENWNNTQHLCSAPTFSQAFRWFRDKYNLIGLVEGGYDNDKNIFTYVVWNGFKDNIIDEYYETYEEAELVCLQKLIQIVKDEHTSKI